MWKSSASHSDHAVLYQIYCHNAETGTRVEYTWKEASWDSYHYMLPETHVGTLCQQVSSVIDRSLPFQITIVFISWLDELMLTCFSCNLPPALLAEWPGSFTCYCGYPFHPRVTAVALKKSRSFCQKCRWQVTAKHAYTLRMWLCMKWHGAWLYGVHRTCAETAAVSCGTSHASA